MSESTDDRSAQPDPGAQARMEELAVEVALDPGGAAFPTLADAYRKAGRLQEARRVAEAGLRQSPQRVEGRVALALTLLDLGEADAGRAELAQVLAADPNALSAGAPAQGAPPVAPVAAADVTEPEAPVAAPPELVVVDEEIELAFEAAETDPDEMVDATRVAQQAMRAGDLLEPEGGFTPTLHPDFATQTMADLLEDQGDTDAAARIRTSLERLPETPEAVLQAVPPAPPAASQPPGAARRERIVRTLESWLDNIRREVA